MSPHHPKTTRGESILEILLAVAIFAIVLPAILYTMGALASSQPERNIYFDALVFTEETKNTIQQIKSANWDSVATNGTYTLETVGETDVLVPISITPTPSANGFIRTIEITEVRRENGSIVSEGGVVDGATKKVAISISWETSQSPVLTELYITRSDMFDSYSVTNTQDFSSGLVLFGGTKVLPSGEEEDAEITLDAGEPDPEVGIRSWWKMSGEFVSSLAEIDAAPNGTNNLQIFGNPLFETGRFNKKVVLDSNTKYLVASSSASLEITEQLSVVAWVKTAATPDNSVIVHKQSSMGAGYRLEVKNTGVVSAQVGNGTTTLTAQSTADIITDNLWHQIAATYDGSTLLVFVDGIQGDVTGAGVDVLSANTEPLFIGKHPSYTNRNFTGDIDDVQIYGTALTPDELKMLLYSTYTSSPRDFGRSTLVHSVGATAHQPQDTQTKLQVGISEPVAGSCDNAYYKFVGPDNTEMAFFETAGEGEVAITSLLPGTSSDGFFINPGQCLRWRAYLYSAKNYGADDPSLKDIRFTYSQ